MFFGLCNSPATFQQFMNDSFRDMIAKGWLVVYMDDLLISSPDHHLDTECTKQVLQRLKELDLHLKIKKCKFGMSHIDYLGMILSPGHIEMDPTKLDGIRSWPTPTKVKDVHSFLGFANFYRKFIGDYSYIACPLLNLTKKDIPWNWNNSCQNAFNRLKNHFLTKPVLHLPDTSKPFTITTDTSKYALGGILLQPDSNGEWHPCSYLSQSLGAAEWNYDIYDGELLTIICGLKNWRHYLQGSSSPVQVFTNHKNLTFFKQAQKLNRRQAQWMLDLADYNLKLIHIPGSKLCTPDALSQWPNPITKIDNDNEGVTLLPHSLFINLIDTDLNEKIVKSLEKDPLVLNALQALEGEVPTQFRSHLLDWSYDTGILAYQGQVFLPDWDNIRWDIVKLHHDHPTAGHPGYLKTCQLVSAGYWWPRMAQYIWKYVEGCSTCQQNKTNTHPTVPPPPLNPIPLEQTLPFKQISYDLITGLPLSNGFDALLVVVDHGLSKGAILCPMRKTVTADGVAAIIFWKLYAHFGLFDKVISDCGPQFTANFAKEQRHWEYEAVWCDVKRCEANAMWCEV